MIEQLLIFQDKKEYTILYYTNKIYEIYRATPIIKVTNIKKKIYTTIKVTNKKKDN